MSQSQNPIVIEESESDFSQSILKPRVTKKRHIQRPPSQTAKPIEHSDSDSDGLVFDRTPYIPPVCRPPRSKAVKQPVIPVAKKSHFCKEKIQQCCLKKSKEIKALQVRLKYYRIENAKLKLYKSNTRKQLVAKFAKMQKKMESFERRLDNLN